MGLEILCVPQFCILGGTVLIVPSVSVSQKPVSVVGLPTVFWQNPRHCPKISCSGIRPWVISPNCVPAPTCIYPPSLSSQCISVKNIQLKHYSVKKLHLKHYDERSEQFALFTWRPFSNLERGWGEHKLGLLSNTIYGRFSSTSDGISSVDHQSLICNNNNNNNNNNCNNNCSFLIIHSLHSPWWQETVKSLSTVRFLPVWWSALHWEKSRCENSRKW